MTRFFSRPLPIAAALALTAGAAYADGADLAQSRDLRVIFDQARVVKLDAPAKTIIVGNPLIADATMVDERTVYVLGRMFGQTNLIAVGSNGEEVLNIPVSVTVADQQMVSLYRGSAAPKTLSCAPRCEWVLKQGDEATKTLAEDVGSKQNMSVDAAKVAKGGN